MTLNTAVVEKLIHKYVEMFHCGIVTVDDLLSLDQIEKNGLNRPFFFYRRLLLQAM